MPIEHLVSDKALHDRVQKGIAWLDAKTKELEIDNWKYRLFSTDGAFRFLGQLDMAETSILVYAFGNDLDIKKPTDVGISCYFDMSSDFRVSHGFFTGIASQSLNRRLTNAWEQALRTQIEEEADGLY